MKSVYLSSCKVPVFILLYRNVTLIFLMDFRRIHHYQISWKSVRWEAICSWGRWKSRQKEKQIWWS